MVPRRRRVLLIEERSPEATPITSWLTRLGGWEIIRAHSMAEAQRHESSTGIDLLLVDLRLPDVQGLATVRSALERFPHLALVVLAGSGDEAIALEALELGAQDYLDKDSLTGDGLERSIRYAMARHRTQRRLNETSAELANANGELSDLMGIIAHELRAPVRTARLFADRMLARMERSDPFVHDLGNRLERSLARVDDLMLALSDYTSLRSGSWSSEVIDVGELCSEVGRAVAQRHRLPTGAITVELPPGIVVNGSRTHLERVMDELLENSVRFCRSSATLTIRISALSEGDTVRLSVADNGLGVPAGHRERVFQVMERLEPNLSGPGFGLATCRRIVDGFNGSIWIEPSNGAGTTVIVELPTMTSNQQWTDRRSWSTDRIEPCPLAGATGRHREVLADQVLELAGRQRLREELVDPGMG